MDKTLIIELIEKWDQFESTSVDQSIENFAHWLLEIEVVRPELYAEEHASAAFLSRLDRINRTKVRRLFHDVPLVSYDDFVLLYAIHNNPNIAKKDLYDQNYYEMNSGTQIVNRLKRMGLIEDFNSKHDRRVSLVRLSPKGEEVYQITATRLCHELTDKFACLSEGELKMFLKLLRKLSAHNELRFAQSDPADS